MVCRKRRSCIENVTVSEGIAIRTRGMEYGIFFRKMIQKKYLTKTDLRGGIFRTIKNFLLGNSKDIKYYTKLQNLLSIPNTKQINKLVSPIYFKRKYVLAEIDTPRIKMRSYAYYPYGEKVYETTKISYKSRNNHTKMKNKAYQCHYSNLSSIEFLVEQGNYTSTSKFEEII